LRKEEQKILNVGKIGFPINSRMIEKTLQVCGPEMEQKGNTAEQTAGHARSHRRDSL
jgi:hypothetical protein